MSALPDVYRDRLALVAPTPRRRLRSDAMILKGAHHTAAAYPELQAWVTYARLANKRQRTLESYERYIAHLLIDNPDTAFHEFTDDQINLQLEATPPRSRQVHKSALNAWFKWGLKTRRLTVNPVDLAPDFQYRPNRNIQVFSDVEAAALRALRYPDGLLMTVLLGTGLRNQEARFLTVQRVDFREQQILVREGAKGGKERVVPMTTAVTAALDELIRLEGLGPTDHLWASRPGGGHRIKRSTPVSGSTFHRWWAGCLADARVEYRKPHTTRHSYATYWLDRIDDGEVQDNLGHESISTTRDIYQHRSRRRTGEKMREIEAQEAAEQPVHGLSLVKRDSAT